MIWLFLSLWAAMLAISVLAIAAVPTTEAKPSLRGPLVVTGSIAALVTLVAAGFISLFS